MTISEFKLGPWKNSHPKYDASLLSIRPAPEFATSEVLVASLYRNIGFKGHREGDVPAAGKELDRKSAASLKKGATDGRVSPDTWRTVLHGALESPKTKQSSKRYLSLSPVVPEVALFSGAARLVDRSLWNPGQLARRLILYGSSSAAEADVIWSKLFAALSVDPDDDVWARWLSSEFTQFAVGKPQWEYVSLLGETDGVFKVPSATQRGPSVRFCKDVVAVVDAKSKVTRRQWVSLLESVLRLGCASHVIWLCGVNERLWRMIKLILDGIDEATSHSAEHIAQQILSNAQDQLPYEAATSQLLKNFASGYLGARLGINLVMWRLEELGAKIPSLKDSNDFKELLSVVRDNRSALGETLINDYHELRSAESMAISCKRGIGVNITEFLTYTLGQKQADSDALRGYDQGYYLRKRGQSKSARWILSLGPVAVLALVHCCLSGARGPRSIQRLARHLSDYGIGVDIDDISNGDLGRTLRMLGLVLDSPDAESGMLLMHPFAQA